MIRGRGCRCSLQSRSETKDRRWHSLPTLGLYSAFLACSAIVLRSKRHSRLTVATMFLHVSTLMKGLKDQKIYRHRLPRRDPYNMQDPKSRLALKPRRIL